MRKASHISTIMVLTLFLIFGSQIEAEAQRRGGGHRSGTYKRTNARGKTQQGTWQTNRSTERGQGYRKSQRNTTVNTDKGAVNSTRNSQTTCTGENTYERNWDRTRTGPNGNSRTWSGEGTGTVDRTENGATRNYQGTVTSPKGNEYGVDKTTTKSKTDDGWERSTTKTVTDSNGNVVGTGQKDSTGSKGEGVETTGSWTNSQGRTTTYKGNSQRTEDGLQRDKEWTNDSGEHDRSVRWRYVDGQWVRESEDSKGRSSEITVDN